MPFLYYHVGLILFAAGVIIYARCEGYLKPLLLLCAALAALCAVHVLLLSQHPEYFPELKEILRELNGQPSTWPYLKFATYLPFAAAAYLLILAHAAVRLARGHTVPDHFLFFLLGVWLPVFCIGIFDWHIPRRYTFSFLAPFLVCFVAGVHYVWTTSARTSYARTRYGFSLVLLVPLLMAVDPRDLSMAFDRSYESAPDHKGAGAFMKSRPLGADDLVLAEDVLQQAFYFGEVDYWLRSVEDASGRVKEKDGELYNYMRNVPLIGSGAELAMLLRRQDRGAIYIIGSGEKHYLDHRKHYLGNGILEILERNRPEEIFTGRDGATSVMYFPPPSTARLNASTREDDQAYP